ncbi:polysaccharide pyruvyl transferase family protein [Gordonia sp. Z-3]|uniref:polysaccharide pyruvyl transferase family protein n=1 Tax=Gordonia sp. Z-3 TaxID=3115408 RepID=UPI003FA57C4F
MTVYVPLIGQYDNIGDIVLRRQLLDWLSSLEDVHAYVGDSPLAYDESLLQGLRDRNVRLSKSFSSWYKELICNRDAAYVFKPGELQLSLGGLKEHIALLPAAAAIRARRSRQVLRVGAGVKTDHQLYRWLIEPSVRLATPVVWREPLATRLFGGRTEPDLAFGQGTPVSDMRTGNRERVSISLRGDRPLPPQPWFDAVQALARDGYELVVVTQVARDQRRSAEIADRIGGRAVLWEGRGHTDQESRLREEFSTSSIAISDRLHVLILALTEGAAPVCNLPDSHAKISRHMEAAGITCSYGPEHQEGWSLSNVISGRPDRLAELSAARARLEAVRVEVQKHLSSRQGQVAA